MALNGLFCADVPLRNDSLTHKNGINVHPSGNIHPYTHSVQSRDVACLIKSTNAYSYKLTLKGQISIKLYRIVLYAVYSF